jgi:hypothetical protein
MQFTPLTFRRAALALSVTLAGALTGCAVPHGKAVPAPVVQSNPGTLVMVQHTHEVAVEDSDNKPLAGATATFELTANDEPLPRRSCTTGLDGKCSVKVNVKRNPGHATPFASNARVSVQLSGHYGATAESSNTFSGGRRDGAAAQSAVTLLRPSDYLTLSFLQSSQDAALRSDVLRLIPLIRMASPPADTELHVRSVGPHLYKGRKYLRLAFSSQRVFDAGSANRQAVGQRLFDESVRPLLGAMASLANTDAFDGVDIVMEAPLKDPSGKSVAARWLEYRFVVPNVSARRFKNQQITAQQLIDQSTVFLGNERIDLKL